MVENIFIGIAQHFVAQVSEVVSANSVFRRLSCSIVIVTVYFYNKVQRKAGEICNIVTNGVLPSEVHAKFLRSQFIPDTILCHCHIMPQSSGISFQQLISIWTATPIKPANFPIRFTSHILLSIS